MKRKPLLSLVMTIAVIAVPPGLSLGGEKVESLRGAEPIAEQSLQVEDKSQKVEEESLPRTFVHQPPLIPHSIDDLSISLDANDCLDCHGEEDADAPRPHASHYSDRAGKELGEISKRWHFCTQCHVRQAAVKPLIINTFKP
jgi:cytochrome c-type protein NapB